MKKIVVFTAFALVAVAALLFAGYAYAQTQTPIDPVQPYGPGMMAGRGSMMGGYGRGGGMMGRWADGSSNTYGPMHSYMLQAFADKFGMTVEDVQAELDAGKTMWDIAESKGLSTDDFSSWMIEARTQALSQAVTDGLMTQEQADWMTQRMQQMQANGFGPGNCPMQGGRQAGRWNNQP